MARVDGWLEAERGRLICELLATPALEHAVEVWNVGSKDRVHKLDAIQEMIGRNLVGGRNTVTVAAAAVKGLRVEKIGGKER